MTDKECTQVAMVNWQVTATTIYCNAIDEEVTVMVYKDWSVKCTGYNKYHSSDKEASSLLKKKSKRLKRQLECLGTECPQVTRYKEKLLSEESQKK